MKLLIDIGNTRIKWASLSNGKLHDHGDLVWDIDTFINVLEQQWRDSSTPTQVLISNVAGSEIAKRLNQLLEKIWAVSGYYVSINKQGYGIINGYTNPKQLGIDRWVALIGAWHHVGAACCIIDCGTAVTVDVLDAEGQHLGGQIAPGWRLMGHVLTEKTHALDWSETASSGLANNTHDGITAGCRSALLAYVESSIVEYQDKNSETRVILTGGEAEMLLADLSMPVSFRPHLVLEGLAIMGDKQA